MTPETSTPRESQIRELAIQLRDNWVANYTLSGALAFQENEAQRADILRRAEDIDAWVDVYGLANDLMN